MKSIFSACSLGLVIWLLSATLAACDAQAQDAKVKAAIDQLAKTKGLERASWSVLVTDAATGKTLGSVRPQLLLAPASNLKVVTTAAALDKLGPDYTFKTRIELHGIKAKNGYRGDIVIRGTGDPSMGSERMLEKPEEILKTWVQKIKLSGETIIEGNLIADISSVEPNLPMSYTWADMGNYFGAGVHGVNWMDNQVRIYFKPGKEGEVAQVEKVVPAVNGITWISKVTYDKAGTGDKSTVNGYSADPVKLITGTIPVGDKPFMIKAAMPEPELVLLSQLKVALKEAGVEVKGECLTTNPKSHAYLGREQVSQWEGTLLHEHVSAPLRELVKQTNIFSLNHYADGLLLHLAGNKGKAATYTAGLEQLMAFVKKVGLDDQELYLEDGSGMCYCNAISPADMAKVLLWVQNQPWATAFMESLPAAGINGTLADLGKGTPLQGKLKAKTGSLMRVQNYAGYLDTKSGKRLVVVLMINRYTTPYFVLRRTAGQFFTQLLDVK